MRERGVAARALRREPAGSHGERRLAGGSDARDHHAGGGEIEHLAQRARRWIGDADDDGQPDGGSDRQQRCDVGGRRARVLKVEDHEVEAAERHSAHGRGIEVLDEERADERSLRQTLPQALPRQHLLGQERRRVVTTRRPQGVGRTMA